MTRRLFRVHLVWLLVTPLLAAWAAPATQEVVVTVSRLPEKAADVCASVSVLAGDALRQAPARHVDDALRTVPGLYALRSVGLGYGLPVPISLRAVPGQNAVLLLADGLPVHDPGSGFIMVNELFLEDAARIEVVRGPFSALYGADAFAGVIQVITAPPDELPPLSARLRLGSENYREAVLQGAAGDADAGFTVTAGARGTDNVLGRDTVIVSRTDPATGAVIDAPAPAANYDYEDRRVRGTLRMRLGTDARLDLVAAHAEYELGYGTADYRPLYPEPVDTDLDTDSTMLGAVFGAGLAPDVAFKARAAFRNHTRHTRGLDLAGMDGPLPRFAPSRSSADSTAWFLDGAADVGLGHSHTLTAGIDYRRSDADFSPLRDAGTGLPLAGSTGRRAHATLAGLYLQDRADLGDRISLLAGVRVDEHSAFGSAVSPKAGLLVRAGRRTRLRASVGRAFRAPTLNELYQPDIAFGAVTFAANPDLDPETILSADTGIEHTPATGLRLHLDVFYNAIDDLIATEVRGTTLQYGNTDDAWSAGVESGLAWRMLPGLAATLSYTEQRGTNRDTGNDLDHVADRLAAAGLRAGRDLGGHWRAEGALTALHVGDRSYTDLLTGESVPLASYWRLDASARLAWHDRLWAGVTVENAADATYQEWPLVNPAPGRLWVMEIGARW